MEPDDRGRVRFRPDRVALAPVVLTWVSAIPLSLSKPWLTPLLLVPLACTVWVLRASVVAAPVGIGVCNGLRQRRFTWDQVEGVQVRGQRSPRLLVTGGAKVTMSALKRRDLPAVLAVGERAAGVARATP